jgi:hypothetical protein
MTLTYQKHIVISVTPEIEIGRGNFYESRPSLAPGGEL